MLVDYTADKLRLSEVCMRRGSRSAKLIELSVVIKSCSV